MTKTLFLPNELVARIINVDTRFDEVQHISEKYFKEVFNLKNIRWSWQKEGYDVEFAKEEDVSLFILKYYGF